MPKFKKYRVYNTSTKKHKYKWSQTEPSDDPDDGGPIDTSKTIVLKGDGIETGGGGGAGIALYPVSLPKKKYKRNRYEIINSFIFPSFTINNIIKIDVLGHLLRGDSYDVRLVDRSHPPAVLCTTNFTNIDDSIQTLNSVIYTPTDDSIIDIEVKFTGTRAEGYVYGLLIYYEI